MGEIISREEREFEVLDDVSDFSRLENYGTLPIEILHIIFLFLPICGEYVNMIRTCKLFYKIGNTSLFWRSSSVARFGIEKVLEKERFDDVFNNWKYFYFKKSLLIEDEDPTELFNQLCKVDSTSTFNRGTKISTGEYFSIQILEFNKLEEKELITLKKKIRVLSELGYRKFNNCVLKFEGLYYREFLSYQNVKQREIWIVKELTKGTLTDVIMHSKYFSEIEIATICKELLLGLLFLKKNGIVHRELSADNVLISSEGNLKLTEFDSPLINLEDLNSWGNPYWISPEYAKGETEIGFKTSVWSLGILLMELAEGEPPFLNESPEIELKKISKGIVPKLKKSGIWSSIFTDFLDLCLQKSVEKRAGFEELISHPFLENISRCCDFLKI